MIEVASNVKYDFFHGPFSLIFSFEAQFDMLDAIGSLHFTEGVSDALNVRCNDAFRKRRMTVK